MANHEINVTCPMCQEEYDVRRYDHCPACGQLNPHAMRRHDLRSLLTSLGFERRVLRDRDGADFDNVMVVDYSIHLGQECQLLVSELYLATEPSIFDHRSTMAELVVDEVAVPLRYSNPSDVVRYYTQLKGMLKL